LIERIPEVADSFGEAFANIEQIRLIDIGGPGAGGQAMEGAVERFLDTLPGTLFKFLQSTSALLGGPIDDLVAAWIVDEAHKRGVDVGPEQQETIREMVATRIEEAEAEEAGTPGPAEPEAEAPAEEVEESTPDETEGEEAEAPEASETGEEKA
jgi:hypothetical protein